MSTTSLTGWGRTNAATATLRTPTSEQEVLDEFASGARVIPRGLGRSYGDAAQLSGGVVLDNRGFNTIGAIDESGVVTLGAGVSIEELLRASIPQGWFVPVTPGTRQVTMGGAVAADVHGKNHHVEGSFAHHVRSMRLVTPVGALDVSPTSRADLFWATMGAMGLTGVLTELTLTMTPIETDQMLVDTERFADLASVMEAMSSGDESYRYSVAWVDCMTRGAHMGRAILTRGTHASARDVQKVTLRGPRSRRPSVFFEAPRGLLNQWSVRAFNELWFRSAPRHEANELQPLTTFFYPLDGLDNWNKLYGRRGFVQYQFCVPDEAADTVVTCVERLAHSRVPSFLAVLKRFGPANPGPLSFPLKGWTLALDLPVGPPELSLVLDELDELVAGAKGRVYFAKDARLKAEWVPVMYPRLAQFQALKTEVDPRHQLTSDLARRLELIGA